MLTITLPNESLLCGELPLGFMVVLGEKMDIKVVHFTYKSRSDSSNTDSLEVIQIFKCM